MWQPNNSQWWVLVVFSVLIVVAWPPRDGKSLAAKLVNWVVDPMNQLPTLPDQLALGSGDDPDAVNARDMQVQQYAEMILGEDLRQRRSQISVDQTQYGPQEAYYSAPTGSVVVEDPANGQIIAMASYPTFDNRWFTQPLPQTTFNALFATNDPEKAVLVNRAITGRYQLGSTMKMISATAGLMYNQLPAGAYATAILRELQKSGYGTPTDAGDDLELDQPLTE